METERDGVHRRQGLRLETFLVEWKPRPPLFVPATPGTLKPS